MDRYTFSAPNISGAVTDPANDQRKLAALGDRVRARLAGKPGIVSLGGDALDLFLIPQFMSEAECARLVKVIDSKIGPSTLFKGTEIDGFRTSSTHHFEDSDPEIAAVRTRISKALGIDESHAETMQGQRYMAGQQYKHHFDYFFTSQEYWQQERRRGGQRSWTAMLCLNEPEEGGETNFAKPDISIPPKPGTLVVWNNMDRSGHPNGQTLHAGTPVLKGRKYVITQWFRQEEWSHYLR